MKLLSPETLIPVLSILLPALLILLLFLRRLRNIRLVRSMTREEKSELISPVLEPLGYFYDSEKDLIVTRPDAWQRSLGYHALYDKSAVSWNMVFDCCPIYFNYQNQTWLIEFWKGQYGICVGCEIGIYHADRLLTPDEYSHELFNSATDDELLSLAISLKGKGIIPQNYTMRHWWLGIFSIGYHLRPSRLEVIYEIRFPNYQMQEAFLHGLSRSIFPADRIRIGKRTVSIYHTTENALHQHFFRRLMNSVSLGFTALLCKLYRLYTKPFSKNGDQLTFLYYQLPFLVRHLFALRKYKKSRSQHFSKRRKA